MIGVQGLPDLASPLLVEGERLFRAVGEVNQLIHIPRELEVAPNELDPTYPDFSVELVRGQSPSLPPKPYGVLDLRVRPTPLSLSVLEAAKLAHPGTIVTSALFEAGHLRLRVLGESATADAAVIAELEEPSPVASNGFDGNRLVRRLTPEAAVLLKKVLEEGALTITAVAEMVMRALADRTPAAVTLDPKELVKALLDRADDQRRIAHDAIVSLWTENDVPVVAAEGLDGDDRDRVVQVLADWTVAACADPVAAPPLGMPRPTVRIRDEAGGGGVETWNLQEGRTIRRTVLAQLHPLDAARQVVAGGGMERIWRQTVVPSIETGFVVIDVDANLPARIVGVVKVGVELSAPPAPPDRVHPLQATLLFDGGSVRQRVMWRISPTEPLQYRHVAFVIERDGGGARRLEGPLQVSSSRHLLIGAADLPVELVSISAGRRLLAEAVIRGTCRPREDAAGNGPTVPFELTADAPAVTVALTPEKVDGYVLDIEACPRSGGDCVSLVPVPARSLNVDLPTFPQFGPQTVSVTVEFDSDVGLVGLELLAEHADVDRADGSVLSFTPDRPSRQWTYLSHSPFKSGYRYRARHTPPAEWSAPRPAGSALHLTASALMRTPRMSWAPGTTTGGNGVGPDENASVDDIVVVEGVELRPDPSSSTVWIYLPPGPQLERGADGTPAISLIESGPVTFLQATSRVDLLDADRARILEGLRRQRPSGPTSIRPRHIVVNKVALQVRPDEGEWTTLSEGTSTGAAPWTTALSATLTPEQARAVKTAMGGKRERLRLVADLTIPPDAHVEAERTRAAGVTFTTAAGTVDLGLEEHSSEIATGTSRSLSQVIDIAELFPSN